MALTGVPGRTLAAQVAETIERRRLVGREELILVAVSGGPDSTALLHALHALGYRIHAAHLNHGLRADAEDEASYVRQFCEERGIPITIGREDVAKHRAASSGSVQEIARLLRYRFLERTAEAVGADAIATAHTRDDNVETILLNIMRGSGADGLRGIPCKRGRIVRPLLDTDRGTVEEYCAELGLEPKRDPSNESTKYARNEVRLKLLPYLEERFNTNVRDAILRLSEIAGAEGDYLDEVADRWLRDHEEMRTAQIGQLPVALQRRVLRRWLEQIGAESVTDFKLIESMRSRLGERFSVCLPGQEKTIQSDGERFSVMEPRVVAPTSILLPFTVPSEAEMPGWLVHAEGSLPESIECVLRTWRNGDRIQLKVGTKKLQDIFTDAKVPRVERYAWPLLADKASGEVLAVANLRISVLAPELRFTAERTTKEA